MVIEKDRPYGATVRLKFSMGISYLGRILAIAVNLIFTLIITRKLTIKEMSWWAIFSNYLAYIGVFSVIYTFWASRAISRGWNVSKVALRLSGIIGGLAAIASIPVLFLISRGFGIRADLIAVFLLVILVDYITKALLSVSQGHAPQHLGIYQVVFAATRAILAYLTLVMLRFGIAGALIALLLSKVIVALMLFLLNGSLIIRATYDHAVVRGWLRLSWYPLSLHILDAVSYFDVLIIGAITHDEFLVACFGVVRLLILWIAAVTESVPSIYAKILARRDLKIVEEGMWFFLLMMTPAIAILLGIPEPIIAVLGIKYLPMSSYIWPFVLATGMNLFFSILQSSVLAWESSDENIYGELRFTRTIFFDLLIVDVIQVSFYLALVAVVGTLVTGTFSIMLWWGIVMFARFLLGTLLVVVFASRRLGFNPITSRSLIDVVKFSFIGLVLYIASRFMKVEVSEQIFVMLRFLIPPAAMLFALYIGLALILDRRTRNLVRSILLYVKKAFLSLF